MVHRVLLGLRNKVAKDFSKSMLPKDFSIISDDCWAGQLYFYLGIPGITPTIGLGLGGDDYLSFLQNLRAPDAADFTPRKFEKPYPVGETPYAKIHFYHSQELEKAISTFKRRYERINWEKLLYKIDLEKPYYTAKHIEQWNELKLPNSVAFYSERTRKIWKGEIHNGVYCNEWTIDGSSMFNITRRYFNIYQWVNSGKIRKNLSYRVMNFLLYDPTSFRRLKYSLLGRTGYAPVQTNRPLMEQV